MRCCVGRRLHPRGPPGDVRRARWLLAEQPSPGCVPGVEAATGSLGHGLPLGLGMALAGRIQGEDFRVFVALSDGECNEGSVWEAAMFAAAQKLDNAAPSSSTTTSGRRPARTDETWPSHRCGRNGEAFGWERHGDRRPRPRRPGRAPISVPDGSGKPVAIDRPHGQGQGRLVHGGRQQLALPHPDRRRSREGAQGAVGSS